MTTFEITIIVLLAAIVLLIGFIAYHFNYYLKDLQSSKYRDHQLLKNIDVNTATPVDIVMRIDKQLCQIESNIDQDNKEIKTLLGSLVNLRFNEEGLKSGINPPTGFPYCATPDGVCTNPHGDCINCPKRGTGGTWSTNTSIKAEDAPLQERFNDNKED